MRRFDDNRQRHAFIAIHPDPSGTHDANDLGMTFTNTIFVLSVSLHGHIEMYIIIPWIDPNRQVGGAKAVPGRICGSANADRRRPGEGNDR